MRFDHLNHCVNYYTGIRSVYGTTEQPILTVNCEWAERIRTGIVGKTAASVLQIDLHRVMLYPSGYSVRYRLLLVKLRPESLQNRFFLLEMQLLPFFIITGILFVNGVLNGE